MASIEPRDFALRDGRTVHVRTAAADDAAAYADYAMDVAKTSEFTVTQPHELRSVEKVRERIGESLSKPDALIVVATSGNQVVGEVEFKAREPERMRHHGHFGLGVRSTHRGVGLGRLLMEVLLEWTRSHATIQKVCLGCVADNAPALSLYRSLGFREESRRMAEFCDEQGRCSDDVQMMLWVKPPPQPLDVDQWLSRWGPGGTGGSRGPGKEFVPRAER